MRNLGALLLLLGALGFFYSSSRLQSLDPLPPELSVRESLDLPAGRWEMARFACVAVAGIGLVLAVFVKER
jgi:hypothetical protein